MAWLNEPYARLTIRNNHIICRTTATLRVEGLFGFHPESDFMEFSLRDNLIECKGTPRLFHNDVSGRMPLANNKLVNVTDTSRFHNAPTQAKARLEAPLKFICGVRGELMVDGCKTGKTRGNP